MTIDTAQQWSAENPQFTLYSHNIAPNGFKVRLLLNELGLHYEYHDLEFLSAGMKTPYYESINPNGRIPALIDHSVPGIAEGNGLGIPVEPLPGKELSASEKKGGLVIWESGAILMYLGRKYDLAGKLWPRTLEEESQVMTWLLYQLTGQGPYIGQAFWFANYHPEHVPSAIERYVNETRRVLGVVEKQLARPGSNGWLVLGRITVADLAFYHFYSGLQRLSIDCQKEYPAVYEWLEKIKARPSFVTGVPPKPSDMAAIKKKFYKELGIVDKREEAGAVAVAEK